jgi:hypothetical protein
VLKRKAEREAVERRLTALRDAADSIPDEPPTDAMLDLYNGVREAVRAGWTTPGALAPARQRRAARPL